jgi:uncharacterized protein YcnI
VFEPLGLNRPELDDPDLTTQIGRRITEIAMRATFRALALGILSLGFSAASSAHVTVWPRMSTSGGFEKYVVRVPTEGQIATTSVELAIPNGVTFVSVGVAVGHQYQLMKSGDRVVSIVWTSKIGPGEFAEFSFMARNPKEGKELVWKAVQTFADGSKTEWAGKAGDKRPASVTKLTEGEAGHGH